MHRINPLPLLQLLSVDSGIRSLSYADDLATDTETPVSQWSVSGQSAICGANIVSSCTVQTVVDRVNDLAIDGSNRCSP